MSSIKIRTFKVGAAVAELIAALKSGVYAVAAPALREGPALRIEDLSPVLQCTTFDIYSPGTAVTVRGYGFIKPRIAAGHVWGRVGPRYMVVGEGSWGLYSGRSLHLIKRPGTTGAEALFGIRYQDEHV